MNKSELRIINGMPSVLLDVIRLSAALTVLYIHAHDQWFPLKKHLPSQPGELSHAAVVVFFVLSGYVISYTTTNNNRGPWQYAQARLSRLCSIVIPALLLTAFIEFVIGNLDPVLKSGYTRGVSWPRYLLSGSFISEIWFFSAAPPMNAPLWSLSYEFWYYAIFGVCFYKSVGWRYLLPIIACFIAGPKILLMMPIWLAGCVAYRLPAPIVNRTKAWSLVFLLLFVAALILAFLPPFPYIIGSQKLTYSNQFITDWVIGIFIALALWCLPSGNRLNTPSWTKLVRNIADLTFPIYVLHYPLLVLYRSVFEYRANDYTQFWVAIFLVLIVASLIGILLERQRNLWILFFNWLQNLFKAKILKSKLEF